jgi:EpsD family peptidyl-prolyl cis-trans isomerase
MKPVIGTGLIAAAALLALGACHGKAKAPTGQVVATVDGDEITLREVNAELTGFSFTDDKSRKAAQQQALRVVLNRHILAKAAAERGLDKTPDYAIQKERADQVVLAQQLENTISKSVPATTREEATRYVSDHPDLFAERKILTVEQLRVPLPLDPKISEALKPMSSIDQAAALFTQNHIAFERATSKIDAIGSDPKIMEQFLKLGPNDMLTVPTGQFLVINKITQKVVEPYTGDKAINYATQFLTKQHTRDAVLRDYQGIIQKAEGKVQYAKDFQPAAAPAAKPAATNAAAINAAAPAAK